MPDEIVLYQTSNRFAGTTGRSRKEINEVLQHELGPTRLSDDEIYELMGRD
jgi:hypothetical protein